MNIYTGPVNFYCPNSRIQVACIYTVALFWKIVFNVSDSVAFSIGCLSIPVRVKQLSFALGRRMKLSDVYEKFIRKLFNDNILYKTVEYNVT